MGNGEARFSSFQFRISSFDFRCSSRFYIASSSIAIPRPPETQSVASPRRAQDEYAWRDANMLSQTHPPDDVEARGSILEINGKFNLPCIQGFDGCSETWQRHGLGTEVRINRGHVGMVEHIERFHDQIQMPPAFEEDSLENAQINIGQRRGAKRVAAEAERAAGEREGIVQAGVHPRKRIDRTPAPDNYDR